LPGTSAHRVRSRHGIKAALPTSDAQPLHVDLLGGTVAEIRPNAFLGSLIILRRLTSDRCPISVQSRIKADQYNNKSLDVLPSGWNSCIASIDHEDLQGTACDETLLSSHQISTSKSRQTVPDAGKGGNSNRRQSGFMVGQNLPWLHYIPLPAALKNCVLERKLTYPSVFEITARHEAVAGAGYRHTLGITFHFHSIFLPLSFDFFLLQQFTTRKTRSGTLFPYHSPPARSKLH
jgi:hypothetical protein